MGTGLRAQVWSRPVVAACVAVLVVSCEEPSPSMPPTSTMPPPPPTVPVPFTIPAGLSPALTSMLQSLASYITQALNTNQDLLPRNPQSTTYLQAKIAMLQTPSLGADIVGGQRWAEGQVTSMDGRVVPFVTVFPLEHMRADATAAIRWLEPVLPVLEAFFAAPFPAPVERLWYGFVIGNSGGGGAIYSEDRATYEARTPSTRLPYDAILGHELGHSYIGNESLNQFLELYTYNVIRTGSTDIANWVFTRSWVAGTPTNQDSAAVLDIYQMIGHDAMTRAYRAVYPLRPPYGSALSPAVIQAFVAEVPAALRSQVSEKLARITF